MAKNTSSGAGGAIYNKGIAQILDATGCIKIQKNTSNGKGGAICNENEGQLTLVGCTITGNTGDMAGGVYSSNPITIGQETNITGNKGNDENQEQNVYSASMVAGDYAFEIKPDLSPLSIKASIGLTGASDGGKVVKIVPYSGIEFEDDDVSKIVFDDAHQCVAARSENNDFVQFVLRPIIHGKVTVGGTDVPETILNINLYDEDDNGFCLSNGTTLSDGTYSFSDVTPDLSHKLRIELVEIEKKGYSCADNPKILAAGTVNKETCEVNFDLKKLTGNIEGYVYMEDTHKPVSGATVTLMPE